MKNIFSNIFCKKEIEKLESEIALLKDMLQKKQEVINQTNAFWKRKLYAAKKEGGKK